MNKFDVVLAREPSDVPAWMPDGWREDLIDFLKPDDERSALIVRRGAEVSWYLGEPDDANLDGIARELQAAYAAGLAAGRDHERLDVLLRRGRTKR